MRLGRATAVLAAAAAVTALTAIPATATPALTWAPDLLRGEPAGVTTLGGAATLDPAKTFLDPVPTGLLTLEPKTFDQPTDRVAATIDGDVPAGTTASVDVRGLRSNGAWTEWVPGPDARLPAAVSKVQGRLVLTSDGAATPKVRGVSLTAHPAAARAEGAEQAPLSSRVFATREGLVGGTTANGHVIAERDNFVALPSRRALSPRNTSDYSVKVCAENGRCAYAPVWDIGPWNTRDDYWNADRQEWRDLPLGMPQAQAAREKGYNGGNDQFGRPVANPAGIDLADGVFWDALGLTNNSWVTVEYLWTGSQTMVTVARWANVRSGPDLAAPVVGNAAATARVPVQCRVGDTRWLQIGPGQYLSSRMVADLGPVGPC